jgi:hypothetical protein
VCWGAWARCNYGGERPWFLCPRGSCGRHVAILYGGSDFGCRTCPRLTYETQRVPPANRSLEHVKRFESDSAAASFAFADKRKSPVLAGVSSFRLDVTGSLRTT